VTPFVLYGLTGVALFSMGVYGVVTAVGLVRKVMALNVAGSGVFLFLVAMAQRVAMPFPDPVPHAMVLTGIVVAVSATALALVLICRIHEFSAHPSEGKDDGTSCAD
jgi:multicomponent Na+:H+ antiporter subunit C